MKHLIVLSVISCVVLSGCGSSSTTPKTTAVPTSAASGQFRGSDHMPPEAIAARNAAGR